MRKKILFAILPVIFTIFFFFIPISEMKIITPYNTTEKIYFTLYDLFRIMLNKNNISIKLDAEVYQYAEEINELIDKYRKEYLFYYDKFQRIYPERYFILCIGDSCGYFYFTSFGLINVSKEEVKIKEPLIIWFEKEYFEELIKCIKEKRNIKEKLKEGIVEGKIKVKNYELLVKRYIKLFYNITT